MEDYAKPSWMGTQGTIAYMQAADGIPIFMTHATFFQISKDIKTSLMMRLKFFSQGLASCILVSCLPGVIEQGLQLVMFLHKQQVERVYTCGSV